MENVDECDNALRVGNSFTKQLEREVNNTGLIISTIKDKYKDTEKLNKTVWESSMAKVNKKKQQDQNLKKKKEELDDRYKSVVKQIETLKEKRRETKEKFEEEERAYKDFGNFLFCSV